MPNFNYTSGLPNPPHLPSQDVNDMQINCNSVEDIWDEDHFGFNDNNGGFHQQVSLLDQAAPGIPAGLSGVHFSNTVGGNSWPFWQNALGSFQLTGSASANIPLATANGYTFLPGGLILQWGKFLVPTLLAANVPMNIPFPTAMLWGNGILDFTAFNPTATIKVSSLAVNQLTFGLSSFPTINQSSIYWMAIGN